VSLGAGWSCWNAEEQLRSLLLPERNGSLEPGGRSCEDQGCKDWIQGWSCELDWSWE